MPYELWDYESGNLLGAFESRAEALTAVRAAIERYGRAYVESWGLGRTDEVDLDEPLLDGSELAEAALKPITA